MPVGGRKPKPEGQRRNHHPLRHDWLEVEDVPFASGRKLPAKRPDGKPWPAATRAWWRAVSTMPHCRVWAPSDWQFALDTAHVAAGLHDGDLRQAAELRQREKVLGTTADARRDLRIRYVEPAEVAEDRALLMPNLEEYRRRLAAQPGPPVPGPPTHPPSA